MSLSVSGDQVGLARRGGAMWLEQILEVVASIK